MAAERGLRATSIDLNRGARMQKHPAGHFVCMYEDDPGVYIAEDGTPATEAQAAEAGYDVQGYARLREKKRRLAEARAKIEAEFAARGEEIERDVNAALESDASSESAEVLPIAAPQDEETEVIGSEGGWTMRRQGKRWEVLDAAGEVVESDLSKEEAEALLQAGQSAA